MISRRKEIFFVALCVVFSALFTIGCSDSLLHPAQDGTRILVQLENSSSRSGDTPPPTEKWQGSAWIESRDGSESHHQKISSETDELSITFENIVIGSEIRIHLDVTSSSETAKRYKGSSNWKKIIDGVNVIVIVLKEVEVDAATPTITKQPEGKTESFAAGGTQKITKDLMVEASVSDGGDLTYQWYSNTSSSTTGGTAIGGATSSSYEATVNAKETKYFYCIVTNTNNNVSGNKTASVTSNVAILASIEGSLESITARYNGTNLLVGVSSTDFTVIENYSGGKSVETPLADGSYTVEVPENSIGNVPVTIKSKDGSIQTQITVPIKYELDVDNLTITGGDTVTQNGNLELTAEYMVNGNDSYNLYTSPDSSSSYKIIENVSISWAGAAQQSDKWKANAETNNTGSKTATVKLSTGDQWCVTTDGIEKIHRYTVNAATTSNPDGYYVKADGNDGAAGTFDAPFKTLAHAITQANINKKTIYVIGELTESSESSGDADTVFYVASAVGAMDNPIVIEGYGNGATLNAEDSSKRVFETEYASYITMKNLTITGGNTSKSGGAIYYYQGELTLDNCTIKDNTSTYTGADYGVDGIYMFGSSNSLTMRHTKVENDSVYLTNTSKADLGSGCVLGDITADASSITLSDDVTINGTLNYKTSGGGITISTSLTTATAITLKVIEPNSSSVIMRTASGVDINDEYTKFNLQTEGYTWNISNGAAYLQSSN